jgi:hypothetical protein
MASDLTGLDLLAIQIDGIHMDEDMILVAASSRKRPRTLRPSRRSSIDNLVERGLDPAVPRLFIIDGAKASKAIRRTFGRAAAIQRCQVHKARNTMERLPKSPHASVRRVLRQAWELDDADKAEKLLRNLAQSRTRLVRGLRLDPGRHRRDPHRHAAWIAEGANWLGRCRRLLLLMISFQSYVPLWKLTRKNTTIRALTPHGRCLVQCSGRLTQHQIAES